MEHWKVHQKVCGKTHEEIAKSAASEATDGGAEGPSVVIPLDHSHSPAGSLGQEGTLLTFSLISGASKFTKVADTVRNIHGDKKFLVKVQLGLDMSSGVVRASRTSPLMLYDETRSIHTNIGNTLQPAYRELCDAVYTRGIAAPERTGSIDRLKGYIYARREGGSLRIFTTQFAPMPNW